MAYGKKMSAKKSPQKMAKKGFTPCSRCPSPSSCKRAGKCLAKSIA